MRSSMSLNVAASRPTSLALSAIWMRLPRSRVRVMAPAVLVMASMGSSARRARNAPTIAAMIKLMAVPSTR